jgi:outer membrane protein insertion porin family
MLVAVGMVLLVPLLAMGQGIEMAHRPIGDVRVEGLEQVEEQLVRNAIRVSPGESYDPDVVREDITRITHLGRFRTVTARTEQSPDGTIVLTYVVQEQPLIKEVEVVGNKVLLDRELLAMIVLRPGDPVDEYSISQAIERIKKAYESKGYFVTDVEVDRSQLDETGILIFRIREGPQVRLREVKFEGNEIYSDDELLTNVKSKTYIFILRDGAVSREQLENDANSIRDYYRDRGYLDAQVARRIGLSDDQRDATVTFLIEEGPLYTTQSVSLTGNELYTDEQILQALVLKVGDIYSQDRLRRSQKSLAELYNKLGFIEATIVIERLFDEEQPLVDVRIEINEGLPYTVGSVEVRGNQLTRSRVILRQVRGLEPGRRFDGTGIETTRERLTNSTLFSEASVTVLGSPEDEERDVLLEVKEKNTGSLSFGAGVSSDSGVIGAIDLVQRNFDITDTPESVGEFFSGRAFRGAGQYFALNIQPGDEVSRYAMTIREPYLFDTEYFVDGTISFFERQRDDYDEQRFGGTLGFGQRFGDTWQATIRTRYEEIEISNIDPSAPTDVFAVAGDSTMSQLGFALQRSTVNSRLFPTAGSRWSAGIDRIGALGGDYDFTRLSMGFDKFWTIDEDFLGRKTVFSMHVDMGYVLEENEAPIFERFYAGGHRSLRGFDYRGVGPVGLTGPLPGAMPLSSESVGGDWLFLMKFEYNFPIYEEYLRMVVFMDTGTVQDDIGFDEYRVAVGTGLRLQLPFLAQAPFAFDFAIPLMKEDTDDTRLFSFDLALPF